MLHLVKQTGCSSHVPPIASRYLARDGCAYLCHKCSLFELLPESLLKYHQVLQFVNVIVVLSHAVIQSCGHETVCDSAPLFISKLNPPLPAKLDGAVIFRFFPLEVA